MTTSYCAALPVDSPTDNLHGSTILFTRESFAELPEVSEGSKPGAWQKIRIGARWYAIDPGGQFSEAKFGTLVLED